ncbi:MAG TPA: peptidylprolyl isomerase, partial [Candidatus Limnocylindrales bacterium]
AVFAVVACTGSSAGNAAPVARGRGCPTSQPAPLAAGQTRTVKIETAKGTITIRVDASLAPIATGNFVALASCGFYDGTTFHRIVPGFVIQGGDPTGTGGGGPGYTIADEPVTTPYKRGTVAMARSSQRHSQGSQFFIVLDDTAAGSLTQTNDYAIVGTVTSGMEAADAIAAAAGGAENPANPVAMDKVTVATP